MNVGRFQELHFTCYAAGDFDGLFITSRINLWFSRKQKWIPFCWMILNNLSVSCHRRFALLRGNKIDKYITKISQSKFAHWQSLTVATFSAESCFCGVEIFYNFLISVGRYTLFLYRCCVRRYNMTPCWRHYNMHGTSNPISVSK